MKTSRSPRAVIFTALFTALALWSVSTLTAQPFDPDLDHAPGEILVQFKASVPDSQLSDALQRGALSVKRHIPARGRRAANSGLVLMRTRLPVDQAVAALRNHPAVEYAEPNSIRQHQAVSNDSNYLNGKLWGMYGDATTPSNAFGSQAGEAWAAGNTGSGDIYVAVLDQGIEIDHPDLAPNIARNPGETGLDPSGNDRETNGLDDDGNGYIDDVHGYDFVNNDNTVFDGGKEKDDHGTHVAGTLGAVGGNGLGVAGVCWNVKLFSGKFLGFKGGTVADEVEAIEYFIDLKQRHGLNLIAFNASYTGGYNLTERIAVIRAAKAGILLVAAAGNNGSAFVSFPANHDTSLDAVDADGFIAESAAPYDAVISVAALDSQGNLPSWSNWSPTRVDLAAPGDGILSTVPRGRYGTKYGTSMATPHVTGACALYLSSHPGAFAWEIKDAILGSTIPTPSLSGKTVTEGRLDVSGF